MKKAILTLAVLCCIGLIAGCKSGNTNGSACDTMAAVNDDYPYEIIMTATDLDIVTCFAVTPESFDLNGFGKDDDTLLITSPDTIHYIVDSLINNATPAERNGIDTRGKLTLKYHGKDDMVVFYDRLTMVCDGKFYDVDRNITEWIDRLRPSYKPPKMPWE